MRWHTLGLNILVLAIWVIGITLVNTAHAQSRPAAQPYSFVLENEQLRMKDGVEVAVTYYRPLPKTAEETFPVIMEMVPYRKDDFFALGDYEYGAYFARHGYVVARVDVRGTGGSSGPIPPSEYSEAEISDAVELIDQFSKKSWSNGNVGMYGISWSAFNGLMTAHRKPPALKAIIAAHGSTDLFYNDVHYIDGALHIDSYAHQIDTDNSMPQSPDYLINDEYFQNRFDREPWLFTWLRQQQDSDFWRKESITFKTPLEVPTYLIGGLLDGYRDFVMDVSQTTRAPFMADIGPWNHAWPEYGEPGPNYEWRQKALRWWDHWLKGSDNGILNEPRWTVFVRSGHPPATDLPVVPGEWRCDDNGPGNSTMHRWFTRPQHELHTAASAIEHTDRLAYKAGSGMAAGGWWGEQTGDMAADDAHSLIYDSPPLDQPLTIMGMPKVQLHVAADAPLYQWSVRLEDVAPDGQVSLVSGAIINPSQRISRLEPKALIPGEPARLSTDIHFTTWQFKPGHRVRLSVSNAQFPMIWPTPVAGTTQLFTDQETWIDLPVVPSTQSVSTACVLATPDANETAPFGKELSKKGPFFSSVRNEKTGQSTFTTTSEVAWKLHDNTYQSRESYQWSVNDATPANALYEGERQNVFTITGREINLLTRARIQSDASRFHVTFTKILQQNGQHIREKTWTESIPRRLQ